MVRECVLGVAIASLAGCSLVLDFSDEQIPKDASTLPYTQEQCGAGEPNDTLATASVLATGATTSAAICVASPDDRDFHRFTVAASATVTIRVTYTDRPAGDLDVKLLDAFGSTLAQSRGFSGTETITCPGSMPACAALAPGDYVLEVFPALPGSTNAYDLLVVVTAP